MNLNWEPCLDTRSSNINSALSLQTKIENDQENENVKATMNLIKKKRICDLSSFKAQYSRKENKPNNHQNS